MVRRAAAPLLVAAALATMASEARADLPRIAGSVHGADVEMTRSGALTLGMGWPSLFARYDFATSGRFGIGIRSDLFWGHIGWGWGVGFGFGFDVPMRIQVFERRNWAVAISLDPGFFIGFDDAWYNDRWWTDRNEDIVLYGPRFGVGVIVSVQPRDFINVFFGLRGGIDIIVVDPQYHDVWVDVNVPFRPFGGIELSVHRSIAVFADFSVGPAIGSTNWCRDWDRDGDCNDWRHEVGVHFTGHFYTGVTFFFGR